MYKNPIYYDDDDDDDHGFHNYPDLSVDETILSVSHELDLTKAIFEEQQLAETEPTLSSNRERYANLKHAGEIQVGAEIGNGPLLSLQQHNRESISASKINQEAKESAIRRETEGDFRLLGRRAGGRFFGLEEGDHVASTRHTISFSMEDNHRANSNRLEPKEASSTTFGDEESTTDGEYGDEQDWERSEPEIICGHLDHINLLGLNKTTLRLRYLVNWLVTSLLQLQFPSSEVPLVQIYGPKIKYERGAAVAFNVRQCSGGQLIHPEVVQKLADKNGISLGIGILNHVRIVDGPRQHCGGFDFEDTSLCKPMASAHHDGKDVVYRLEVVTASLGFLTNFEDVYKMWAFIAGFLNPSFVEDDKLSEVPEDSEA